MNKLVTRFVSRLVALVLILAGAGCSPKAKSARHLEEANRYFAAGDYDKAEVEYKNAFQADATNADAIGRLGIIYLDQGRLAQAFGFLRRATELNADNLEVRLKLGMLHLGSGRLEEARDAAKYVLTRNPQDPEAPLLLAESTRNQADAEEARAFLQALPGAAPKSAPVLVAMGMIDLRSGNPDPAKALFEQAQTLDPKYAAASAALGRLFLVQRNAAQSEQAMQRAAELSGLRSPTRLQYAQFLIQTGKVEAAKKYLEDITAKAPDFLPAWIQLAEIAFNQRRYDDAMTHLDRVLARYAISPEASMLAGRVRLAQGEYAKAVTILESAATRFPEAPLMHYQLGLAYASAGDLPKATASQSKALALAPTMIQPALALAEIEIRQGNVLLAITSLQKLVQQHPTLAEAQLLLAQAYRAQGNLEEALKLFRNVDATQTRNPVPAHQIGTLLLQLDRKAEARQAFTRALTLAPGHIPAIEQLTNLDLSEKNVTAARSRLEAELAKSAGSAPLHMLMAKVAFANNDLAAGEAALKKVIELAPDSSSAYLQLAQLYLISKQDDKALTNLQSVLANNPKDSNAAMLLGSLQERRRDFTGAKETYEKALTANPGTGALYNNLAYVYSEHLGEPQKGFEAAQKARELLPNSPQVADTLGWSLFKQGQYARALPYLQDAAEKLPDSAEVQFHLGMGFYMLGEEAPAKTALERSLQIDPKFPSNEQARERLALLNLDLKASSAMNTVSKALERDSRDSIALARAGALHEMNGRSNEALASYEAIMKASPGNLGATLKTIQLYESRKDLPKAFDLAKTARKTFPSSPEVAHVLGRLAYKSGDHRWAVSLLQDAARAAENENSELLFDLALATYAIGNAPAAETALKRALELSPTAPRAASARTFLEFVSFGMKPTQPSTVQQKAEAALKTDDADLSALFTLGMVSEQKNDLAAARKHYESALRLYPDFALAQKRLAVIYASDPAQIQKAQELATKARQAYPNDAEVAKTMGIVFFRQKNHARATSLLEEALRQRSTDAEVHYYLGAAQLELKRTVEGKKSVERALELGLQGELAAEARKLLASG